MSLEKESDRIIKLADGPGGAGSNPAGPIYQFEKLIQQISENSSMVKHQNFNLKLPVRIWLHRTPRVLKLILLKKRDTHSKLLYLQNFAW